MPLKVFSFNQGLNTTSDRSMLAPGELQLATGMYFRSGDTARAWKLAGRSLFGTLASAARVWTLALCKFDTAANDKLVCLAADGSLHTADLTTASSGSLTTLTTGLNTSGDILGWTHFDDIWYFGNGLDRNFAYESDGTFRAAGMQPIPGALTGVPTSGTTAVRASGAADTGWNDTDNVLVGSDTNEYTWCEMVNWVTDPGALILSGFEADTGQDRFLFVRFSVGQPGVDDQAVLGPATTGRFDVNIKIEIDFIGAGYVTVWDARTTGGIPLGTFSHPFTDDIDAANAKVRITLIDNKIALFQSTATLRVYDVRVSDQGVSGDFSTTEGGVIYAYAEVDNARGNNDRPLEAFYAESDRIELAGQNAVVLTLPASPVNPLATGYWIYRTHDGGNTPGDLRRIGEGNIGDATWVDSFEYAKDVPGTYVPPYLKVQITDALAHFYPSNMPPFAMRTMVEYQNFVVGLSQSSPRTLFYSLPGFPEYWPHIYQISDFPLQEHDQLVSLAVTGDLLVVGAKEAIIIINGLPEVEAQAYSSAHMTALKGAPGCVGPLAMTAYSLGGEPRVAWISKFGLYETNGHQVWELTHDIDFNAASSPDLSRAALYWDIEDQLLYACYDSDGDTYNDRFFTLHMAPEHRKGQRGVPKVTGPHYGQITNIVGGLVPSDNEYHMYAGDSAATGQIVNEKTGGVDVTNAYNTSSELPFNLKTARIYGPQLLEWAVDFPTIRHLAWGATPVAITWTVGRDDTSESQSVVNTITMSAQKATKFFVARSGEWHEVQITHDGDVTAAAILGIQAEATEMGDTGDTQDS